MRQRYVRIWCCAVVALAACGRGEQQGAEQPAAEPASASVSLTMPGFPEPRRGQLVVVSDGDYVLDGAWPARAATCDDPPIMEVLAEEPGVGTLILLQLPAADRVTDYPVAFAETGAPEPPAAQIGVQLFQGGRAHAFQAMDGSVEVYGYDDRVSGRFAVTLREIASDDSVKYVGVFHGIPIEQLPVEQCRRARAALATSDST